MTMFALTALLALVSVASLSDATKLYNNFPVCCKGSQFLAELLEPYLQDMDHMLAQNRAALCHEASRVVRRLKRRIESAPCPEAAECCGQLVDDIERQLGDECSSDPLNFIRALFDLVATAFDHAGNHVEAERYRDQIAKIDRVPGHHFQAIDFGYPTGEHGKADSDTD